MTPDDFRALGHRMIDLVADYMRTVEDRPVTPSCAPGDLLHALPAHPPERPEAWDDIFRDIDDLILPNLMHWQSPSFFGYFPCNASGPGILGELLSAGLGVQGMLWSTSPACTELEMRMLDWMADAIGLPPSFTFASPDGGGVIQGTASEAALVALVAARHRHPGPEPVVYASVDAHSSIRKAASIAGVREVRAIATDETQRLDPEALALAIREDRDAGRTPC
ncbi:MAG: aspartate aminotransferase family protein, partial [Phycisphaerales bacterium]|nr:aspartate aminotransferase family protein [Phycisphaerales bacterium]